LHSSSTVLSTDSVIEVLTAISAAALIDHASVRARALGLQLTEQSAASTAAAMKLAEE
jgi:hypothetical protein